MTPKAETVDVDAITRRSQIAPLLEGEQKPKLARAVIEKILDRYDRKLEQFPEGMMWLAYALRQILARKDANEAFGLVERRGSPNEAGTKLQGYRMAVEVELFQRNRLTEVLVLYVGKNKAKEISTQHFKQIISKCKKVALETVAGQFEVDIRTVERALKSNLIPKAVPTAALQKIAKDLGNAQKKLETKKIRNRGNKRH